MSDQINPTGEEQEEVEEITTPDLQNKLTSAFLARRAPWDTVFLTAELIASVASNGWLKPVDSFVEEHVRNGGQGQLLERGMGAALYEGKTYPGKVTTVSPEVRDSQVRGTVVFDGETPPGLRQSQRVSVRMVLERKTNVVKTARGPFLESGGGRQAYVVENGVASKREIEVGAVSVSEVEIVKGVNPGERVVVSDTSVFGGARSVLIRN